MMDSHLGYNVGDTVVQKDQVYFDSLQSPDNWSNWGLCGFENSEPAYNFEDGGKMMTELSNERPRYQPVAELSYGSCSYDGSSVDSRPWNLQFDGLTLTESMDDMFFSSVILEDVPATAPHYYPTNLNSQSEPTMMPAPGDLGGRMLDNQNVHCGTDNSVVFQSPPFSTSAGSNGGRSCLLNVSHDNSLDQSHTQSIKAQEIMDMLLSDQAAGCEDSLAEESELLGLEAVLSQLSSQTRLCVRDSLYRLAECSQPSTSAEFSAEFPSLDRTARTTKEESETNRIDRAVANLMFQNPNGQCGFT